MTYKLIFSSRRPTLTSTALQPQGEGSNESGSGSFIGEDSRLSILKASFRMHSADNKDFLKVVVEKLVGTEGENTTYGYQWSINDKSVGEDSDSISGFRRGDTVTVRVTPISDGKRGLPRTLSMIIENTSPKVSEVKELKNDGLNFSCQVMANDPDGDMLSYTLVEPPAGMTIDTSTGIINWQMKEGNNSKYAIRIKVSDNKGGETTYSMEMGSKKVSTESNSQK